MDDFQGRVIAEKRDLDAKHSKLAQFISGDVYPTLDDTDQDLLIDQLDAMKQYSNILGQRIARWAE